MAYDPYDPCPCGSGKKFKWCCQPIYAQIDKAFQQEAEGQHEVALRILDDVCKEHASNPEVWGRKAQLLYQNDKVEDAEAALQKAFDINPNYPFGHYLRGRFRHLEGEIPGALLLFRKAAELYDPVARDVLAHIYALITECELKLNRPVAARAALEMASKLDPANADYKNGINEVFGNESKMPALSRKQFTFHKLAADAPPERRNAWQSALQVAATGKLSDAAKAFEGLTATDENDAAAWFNLGLAKAWLGDNAAAVAALDRSVQLDKDEEQAAQSWALAEVLLCGHGMEEQANYVEHSATFPMQNPEQVVKLLGELQRQRRLIAVQANQEEGILTGLIVEKVQALTPEHAASQMARVGAYLLVVGQMVRLWNANKETFDAVSFEIRQMPNTGLGNPYVRTGPPHFTDVLAEAIAFPIHNMEAADGKQRMADFFARYMEEKWIHKPLKTLGQVPPVDATGHALLRKKLRGLIYFLADCAQLTRSEYDFDRLRRKLGLVGGGTTAAPATMGIDISAMGAPEMAAIDVASLNESQLDDAFQSALKLGAQEIAAKFARALTARPPRADKPDTYLVFNHLVQQALAEGNNDAALDYVNEGEKSDCEHNEGRRRNDYELRRGQVHMKRGEIDEAAKVFASLIERAPAELRYRGTAAEAMLSAKQAGKALQFAEGGLKKSREQNNRDSEQYFLELTAAAKKQGA
ncbi:MAG TPA: tetratricopeptide repeat protein [Gemmataceae bacterium]|nr:tetratricopeptide repeat protein [Gemmataceae bacterium]